MNLQNKKKKYQKQKNKLLLKKHDYKNYRQKVTYLYTQQDRDNIVENNPAAVSFDRIYLKVA